MKTASFPNPLKKEVTDIFDLLLNVNKVQNVRCTLRVAGGWVRDTLLGRVSHDIDIAIETPASEELITGEAFANHIASYNEKYTSNAHKSTISVVKTNPEKSKHIATAQMIVLGSPLEFCHLRHDEYTDVSRVPTVRPGTPKEDALRRDFTVNCLFYNLHTKEVEDFSTGLDDLQTKILRTPLKPMETFLDDPLRLLRGIRFAGQLGFSVHPDIIMCALDTTLVSKLKDKVTRERIGIEVGKMLGGNAPFTCFDLLLETNLLFNTVLQEVYYQSKGKISTSVVTYFGDYTKFVQMTVEEQWKVKQLILLWTGIYLPSIVSELIETMKDDIIILSLITVFIPLIYNGSSLCTDAPCVLATSRTVRADRLTGVIMGGLKQSGIVNQNVRLIVDAVEVVLPFASKIWDIVKARSEIKGQVNGMFLFTGEVREAIFDSLCILATSKKIFPSSGFIAITAAIFLSSMDSGVGTVSDEFKDLASVKDMIRLTVESLKADSNGSLLTSPTAPLPVEASNLPSLVGIDRKETAAYIHKMRRFMLHKPDATSIEAVEFLKLQREE
eukprot:Tbor_TRINITY_DN4361_c0_g1::TRINITY_DN4361_c0_g1_i1::g.7778::m.7778